MKNVLKKQRLFSRDVTVTILRKGIFVLDYVDCSWFFKQGKKHINRVNWLFCHKKARNFVVVEEDTDSSSDCSEFVFTTSGKSTEATGAQELSHLVEHFLQKDPERPNQQNPHQQHVEARPSGFWFGKKAQQNWCLTANGMDIVSCWRLSWAIGRSIELRLKQKK